MILREQTKGPTHNAIEALKGHWPILSMDSKISFAVGEGHYVLYNELTGERAIVAFGRYTCATCERNEP